MATTTTIISSTPSASTITLTSDTVNLAFSKPATFAKSLIIANLSATNEILISFKASAGAATEEFQLNAGGTLNLDFTRSSTHDVWVRGTSGQKFSYMVI